MNYSTIFLMRARKEILEAWGWYEDKQAGLGDRFREELLKRIYEIEQDPERYPQRKAPYRETLVKIFPYIIIYRLNKKKQLVIISSIFHAKRNPQKKYTTRKLKNKR